MAFKTRGQSRATSRVAGLWIRAEADLGAAAAARRLDAEGRRAQVRGRRGDESGKRIRKRRRKESYSCPRLYGRGARISRPSRHLEFRAGTERPGRGLVPRAVPPPDTSPGGTSLPRGACSHAVSPCPQEAGAA